MFAWDTENWQRDGTHEEVEQLRDGVLTFRQVSHSRGDFRLGVIIDDQGARHVYYTRQSMIRAFYQRRWEGGWFWAHNVAYDIQNLWGKNLPGRTCLMGGAVYFLRLITRAFTTGNGYRVKLGVHLADTTRYFPKSLATVGKLISKATGRDDLKKIHDTTDDLDSLTDAECLERCERDARIVHYFAGDVLQPTLNELGTSLNYTIGSASLELWRRTCQRRRYTQLDVPDLDFLNAAYYGGRTEAFYRGRLPKGVYWNGDINSMYPSVMRDLEMPIASREFTYRVLRPGTWVLSLPGVSLCTINVPDMMYPPLPYREPRTGKLIFPVGTLRAHWTHLEINYALSLGCTITGRIEESVYFSATERPYADLMERLFKVREQGGVYDLVGKLLANNLYGKAGMCNPPGQLMSPQEFAALRHEATEQYLDGDDTLANQTASPEEYRDEEGRVIAVMLKGKGKLYPKFANQIWAAMITAGARVKLHHLLVKYDALYCDTDSIITQVPFTPDGALGGLGFKTQILSTSDIIDPRTGEILEEGLDSRIIGPKAYQFLHYRKDWCQVKIKGVPDRRGWYRVAGQSEWCECSDIKTMALQGFEVGYETPLKLLESFKKRELPMITRSKRDPSKFVLGAKIKAKSNAWFFHSKLLKLENTKREALPSGWTRPLKVGQGG